MQNENTLTFGEWVKTMMESKNLQVMETARRLGWKYPQLSRMIADRPRKKDGTIAQPSRATVLALARALEVPTTQALAAAGYAPSSMTLIYRTEKQGARTENGEIVPIDTLDLRLYDEIILMNPRGIEMLNRLESTVNRFEQTTERLQQITKTLDR